MSMQRNESQRVRRIASGIRLIDVAVHARCSPATVRAWEFGVPVRPEIEQRLRATYAVLLGAPTEAA